MLSIKTLSIKNLKAYTGRSITLILFSILMAGILFGGTMIINGVRNGLETVQSRLGADIIVTPKDAKNEFDAQTILIQAEPGYFYMPATVLDEIRTIEGVEAASPQLFLASASSSCCTAKLQIIAFDPGTDFTIQPWIRESFGPRQINLFDIIVGSNVNVPEDYIIRLYNNDCKVVGQFAPTGSSLDNAVYTNFDTIKTLTVSSIERGLNKYTSLDPDDVISSVMVKIAPGANIDMIAEKIRETVPEISAATASTMVSGIAESLNAIFQTTRTLIVVISLISFLMSILLFALMIRERNREFAALQAMGADKNLIFRIVSGEAFTINLLGGCIGIMVCLMVLVGFRSLIQAQLGVGFVIPSAVHLLTTAFLTILCVLVAALISAVIAIQRIYKTDPAEILKEGE